jgi:hypothetical protein
LDENLDGSSLSVLQLNFKMKWISLASVGIDFSLGFLNIKNYKATEKGGVRNM